MVKSVWCAFGRTETHRSDIDDNEEKREIVGDAVGSHIFLSSPLRARQSLFSSTPTKHNRMIDASSAQLSRTTYPPPVVCAHLFLSSLPYSVLLRLLIEITDKSSSGQAREGATTRQLLQSRHSLGSRETLYFIFQRIPLDECAESRRRVV